LAKVTTSKINNCPTSRANKVVMVLWLSSNYVATRVTTSVHLTYKPQFIKYVKTAIDGNQSDARMFLMYPLVYLSRSKMLLA